MEQEYRLTGTLPELQNLLQKEFKMSPQSAKLAACLLILETKARGRNGRKSIGLMVSKRT